MDEEMIVGQLSRRGTRNKLAPFRLSGWFEIRAACPALFPDQQTVTLKIPKKFEGCADDFYNYNQDSTHPGTASVAIYLKDIGRGKRGEAVARMFYACSPPGATLD